MNPGTAGGGGETIVGARCVFLANAHVAHDCRLGDGVILSNNVMLAGHCRVGDFAILGGGSAAHQFVRIGAHAFVGGLTGVENDIIPFGIALGNRASLAGLNFVGLKRRGFSHAAIHALRRAYKHVVRRRRHAEGARRACRRRVRRRTRRCSRSSRSCARAAIARSARRATARTKWRERARTPRRPLAILCGSGGLPLEAARRARGPAARFS